MVKIVIDTKGGDNGASVFVKEPLSPLKNLKI